MNEVAVMSVNRCVCHELSFSDLLAQADARGLDFDGLRALTGCSTGCGLCGPYVRLMLRTRRVSFPVITPVTIERMLVMPVDEARLLCDRLAGSAWLPSDQP